MRGCIDVTPLVHGGGLERLDLGVLDGRVPRVWGLCSSCAGPSLTYAPREAKSSKELVLQPWLPEPHPAEWRDVCLRAPIPHLHAQPSMGKAALGNFTALQAQNFKESPRKGEFKGEAPDLAHFRFGNWKDFYEMTFLLFFSSFIRCHSQDIDIVKPAHHLGQSLLLN